MFARCVFTSGARDYFWESLHTPSASAMRCDCVITYGGFIIIFKVVLYTTDPQVVLNTPRSEAIIDRPRPQDYIEYTQTGNRSERGLGRDQY